MQRADEEEPSIDEILASIRRIIDAEDEEAEEIALDEMIALDLLNRRRRSGWVLASGAIVAPQWGRA